VGSHGSLFFTGVFVDWRSRKETNVRCSKEVDAVPDF
jgi:hypothetical protein